MVPHCDHERILEKLIFALSYYIAYAKDFLSMLPLLEKTKVFFLSAICCVLLENPRKP